MDPEIVERLATLEAEMRQVFNFQAEHKIQTKEINRKLDELLSLRNKGVGAFWLASALTGTGILGAFWGLLELFKNG